MEKVYDNESRTGKKFDIIIVEFLDPTTTTTSKQIYNGVDKKNGFVLHFILSFIIANFQASF